MLWILLNAYKYIYSESCKKCFWLWVEGGGSNKMVTCWRLVEISHVTVAKPLSKQLSFGEGARRWLPVLSPVRWESSCPPSVSCQRVVSDRCFVKYSTVRRCFVPAIGFCKIICTPKEDSLYLKINWLLINEEAGTSLILNTYTHTCIHMFNDAWVLPSESIFSTSAAQLTWASRFWNVLTM